MSDQNTYRSIVRDLVAAVDKHYGHRASDNAIDQILGPISAVYRDAKALLADEKTPTMFVSVAEDGAYAASVTNLALSDIAIVVIDETNHDKDGKLMSIGHAEGTVYSGRVKMLIPGQAHFHAEPVLKAAISNAYKNEQPHFTGVDRAINAFITWREESRPFHRDVLRNANEAISEHGFAAYSDFLVDAFSEFKAGLLAKAKEYEPESDDAFNESRLFDWISEKLPQNDVESVVVAAIYERGIDAVQEAFETSPESGLSM